MKINLVFFDFFSVNANNAGIYSKRVHVCVLHFLTCDQYEENFNIVEIYKGVSPEISIIIILSIFFKYVY